MDSLISGIRKNYPKIKLSPSTSYYWSPETNEIFYNESAYDKLAEWSLLHEVGHALLNHKSYDTDYMLIRLEVMAWQKAKEIGPKFGIEIDENHIQDCLDTYRDWIYKRSICPSCTTKSFQQSDHKHYRCFNCHMTWRVTPSRFCRAYRTKEKISLDQKVFI
jgi:hypothetical protein